VEQLSPNDEEVCFSCHLSLKDGWRELARVAPHLPGSGEINHSHQVQFYSDDEVFLVTFTRFMVRALEAGNAVIVSATESHRESLFQRLQSHGLDLAAAVEEGRLIPLDVGGALSTFMVDAFPDRVRFLEVASALVVAAAKAVRRECRRVAACGECAPLL
jgi:MEDS: MEthanogen/methylotroph, DcmR Sensory domain